MDRRRLVALLGLLPALALAAQGGPVYTSVPTHPAAGAACSGARVQIESTSGKRWCCISSQWAACGDDSAAVVTAAGAETARPLADHLADQTSVLGFIPKALHASIRDGTTTADLSTYINLAVGISRGVLYFPAGTYLLNIDLAKRLIIRGEGSAVTILKPANAALPIFTLSEGVAPEYWWSQYGFRDIKFKGAAGYRPADPTGAGVGVQFGHDVYVNRDEIAGRVFFQNVAFSSLEVGIKRLHGNLGVYIDNSDFEWMNFHIWSRDATSAGKTMHAGVLTARNSEFAYAKKASIYIDSPTGGTGQVVFKENVFQSNQGFLFFVKDWSNAYFTPGLVIDECWNESNYSDASVTIDGVAYTPSFGYFKNIQGVKVRATNLGPYTLVNATIDTDGAQLHDYHSAKASVVTADSFSAQTHRAAAHYAGNFITGGIIETVNSRNANLLRRPTPTHATPAYSTNVVSAVVANRGPVDIGGSTSLFAEEAIPGLMAQSVTVADAAVKDSATFTIPTGSYYVWSITYRRLSGTANPTVRLHNGTADVSPAITLNSATWDTVGGILSSTALGGGLAVPMASVRWRFVGPAAGWASIGIGGMQLLKFDSLQAAIEFANARAFALASRDPCDAYVAAMPAAGSWVTGDTAWLSPPVIGQPQGWRRLTTGSAHVLGTDWAALPNL